MNNKFEWVEFYTELANEILKYKNNRTQLLDKLKQAYVNLEMPFPKVDRTYDLITDIDPFTVFGLFNKQITDGNRNNILTSIAKQLDMKCKIPTVFAGIPLLSNMNSIFYNWTGSREENDINNLWDLYELAIDYADNNQAGTKQKFIDKFETVLEQQNIKWNITMGLFWIRPYVYISLDGKNRWFLGLDYFDDSFHQALNQSKQRILNGSWYLDFCDSLNEFVINNKCEFSNFIELSDFAFIESNLENERLAKEKEAEQLKIAEQELAGKEAQKSEHNLLYSDEDMLGEVYISRKEYDTLVHLINYKKNVILQGAPGVGKTFIAKKLAYSMIGEKNEQQVKLIQFHQSYSYEDFIMGYRPSKDGFELTNGVFYEFCNRARKDSGNKYFFIIDEINRGNLSKIFGELFMLIESDKRDETMELLYKDKLEFSVPKNLYIIGMMNTADRSLAMIDYALRRRFSFYNLEPQFESEKFVTYQEGLNNSKFNKLVECIININKRITEDLTLGSGFCIGHSYFSGYEETGITDVDLAAIVEYELIPLIKEYWYDDFDTVDTLTNQLRNCIA